MKHSGPLTETAVADMRVAGALNDHVAIKNPRTGAIHLSRAVRGMAGVLRPTERTICGRRWDAGWVEDTEDGRLPAMPGPGHRDAADRATCPVCKAGCREWGPPRANHPAETFYGEGECSICRKQSDRLWWLRFRPGPMVSFCAPCLELGWIGFDKEDP